MSKKNAAAEEQQELNDAVDNPPKGEDTVAVLDLADAQGKAFEAGYAQGLLDGQKTGYFQGIEYAQQVLGVRVINVGEQA